MKSFLCVLLSAVVSLRAQSQESESLWTPEGYRILSEDETRSIIPDQLKAIVTRNGELLEVALRDLSSSDRAALAEKLSAFEASHSLTVPERRYVTLVHMRLLSRVMEDAEMKKRDEARRSYESLLIRQEESTRGFPTDAESVEKEAAAIDARIGKEDASALYLLILRPLRARPWNESARIALRKIVRHDPTRAGNTSLYDAVLAFLHAREKESPEEGAWPSMEGFLRLVLRQEAPEARRLFDLAIRKNSRDVESRLFPILLAEMDGNAAEAERLRRRAALAWSKPGELDRVLMESIDALPSELASRARETFGRKYKTAHPADWNARIQHMNDSIQDAELKAMRGDRSAEPLVLTAVDRETTSLLDLPLSSLAEPSRTDIFALQLRARSGLGRCEEVASQIATLDRAAALAYPREMDEDSSPLPHTAAEVAALRIRIRDRRVQVEKLRTSLGDGSISRQPEWKGVTDSERTRIATEMVKAAEAAIAEVEAVVHESDDSRAAVEWTRGDFAAWEERHNVRRTRSSYDIASRAERLSILVRAEQGKCLIARRKPAEAVSLLESCIGGGRNYHLSCVRPMSDAAVALVELGDVDRAVAVYDRIERSDWTDDLFMAIEKAAPGRVHRKAHPMPVGFDP